MFTAVVRYFHIRVSIHSSQNLLQISFPASRNCASKYNKSSLEPMGCLFKPCFFVIHTHSFLLVQLISNICLNRCQIMDRLHKVYFDEHKDLKYTPRENMQFWKIEPVTFYVLKRLGNRQHCITRPQRSLVKAFYQCILPESPKCHTFIRKYHIM